MDASPTAVSTRLHRALTKLRGEVDEDERARPPSRAPRPLLRRAEPRGPAERELWRCPGPCAPARPGPRGRPGAGGTSRAPRRRRARLPRAGWRRAALALAPACARRRRGRGAARGPAGRSARPPAAAKASPAASPRRRPRPRPGRSRAPGGAGPRPGGPPGGSVRRPARRDRARPPRPGARPTVRAGRAPPSAAGTVLRPGRAPGPWSPSAGVRAGPPGAPRDPGDAVGVGLVQRLVLAAAPRPGRRACRGWPAAGRRPPRSTRRRSAGPRCRRAPGCAGRPAPGAREEQRLVVAARAGPRPARWPRTCPSARPSDGRCG